LLSKIATAFGFEFRFSGEAGIPLQNRNSRLISMLPRCSARCWRLPNHMVSEGPRRDSQNACPDARVSSRFLDRSQGDDSKHSPPDPKDARQDAHHYRMKRPRTRCPRLNFHSNITDLQIRSKRFSGFQGCSARCQGFSTGCW